MDAELLISTQEANSGERESGHWPEVSERRRPPSLSRSSDSHRSAAGVSYRRLVDVDMRRRRKGRRRRQGMLLSARHLTTLLVSITLKLQRGIVEALVVMAGAGL